MFEDQIAWYVAGPVMGLCVVACRLLFDARLGVTGGFSDLISKLARGSVAFDWRGFFAIGIVVSGALFVLAAGGQSFHGYGWLTRTLSAGWVAPLLLIAGFLIGYGAKVAGGCTSGNGLSGVSGLSPASLVATATFFGTAIVVAATTEALIV